jgi:hypothetical protein
MPRISHATVVAYLALFVALGGSAYAVENNGGTVTRACYSKTTGALRVLVTGSCRGSERPLSLDNANPADFYTKTQSDARFLPLAGTATNAGRLGGQPPSSYAPASLFGGGVSPASGAGSANDPYCVIGEIELMAAAVGPTLPLNWTVARGQSLPIDAQNNALYDLLGTTYGGTSSTFNLPNLQAADPKGSGPAAPAYVICTGGFFP